LTDLQTNAKASLTHKRRIVLGVCAAYATGLFVVGGEISDALTGESVPPPPYAVPVPGDSKVSIPHVSPALATQAQRQAEEDPAFKAITAGVGYEVVKVGPWTTANSRFSADKSTLTLLGVSLMIHLEKPVSFTNFALPQIAYDPEEKNPEMPYAEATFSVSAQGLSDIMVMVDTRRNTVVAIVPAPSAPPAPGTTATNPVVPSVRMTPPEGYENPFKPSED
jgi:hypothetical protein